MSDPRFSFKKYSAKLLNQRTVYQVKLGVQGNRIKAMAGDETFDEAKLEAAQVAMDECWALMDGHMSLCVEHIPQEWLIDGAPPTDGISWAEEPGGAVIIKWLQAPYLDKLRDAFNNAVRPPVATGN